MPSRTVRRARSLTALIATGAAIAIAIPADASPAFTTASKSKPDPHPSHPTQVWRLRPANDGTFDRVVIDERFSISGYTVRYVTKVYRDASGKPVKLDGRYYLTVSIPDASTSGAAGTPTEVHATLTPNLPEVVQIKKTGDFEGVVSFAIGLRRRNGFRIQRLQSPRRLVIDVLH
jgi:hypothetical protein